MNDMAMGHKEKLMSDLKIVVADAEELLRTTADETSEGAVEMRKRVQNRINEAKTDLAHLRKLAIDKAKAVGSSTDEFVHANPWKSMGIAASLGIVAGVLLSRR